MENIKTPSYVVKAINELERIFVRDNNKKLEKLAKFTRGETFVLKVLLNSTEPVTPTELSKTLKISKARISAILKALERKNRIIREVDKNNKRNVKVFITDEGRQAIEKELEEGYNFFAKALSKMSKNDAETFVKLTETFLK